MADDGMTDAEKCRANGWIARTRLVGDEGYGPTIIEITAVGDRAILAKTISHNGEPDGNPHEGLWTLSCRDWTITARPGSSPAADGGGE